MKALIDRIAEMQDKRARYWRTVTEIKAMSLDTALDLDIAREDAHKIAYEAVYGTGKTARRSSRPAFGWEPAVA